MTRWAWSAAGLIALVNVAAAAYAVWVWTWTIPEPERLTAVGGAAAFGGLADAAIAATAAVVALVVARRTLQEAEATTKIQRETADATALVADRIEKTAEIQRDTTAATALVAERIEKTTQALRPILVEAQGARELEQLRLIANQVAVVTRLRKRLSGRYPVQTEPFSHHDFTAAKELLAAYLEAVPAPSLPSCRQLADPTDARLSDPQLENDATQELKQAFATAGVRLLDATT